MGTSERFLRFGTSLLSDALDALGHPEQVLGPGLRPVTSRARFAGPVKTIAFAVRPRDKWFPEVPRDVMIAGLQKREKQVSPGDVLVIACRDGAPPPYAILGDLGAATYKNLGVAGIVANGFVRDVEELVRLELPVVAAGTTPVNGRGRAATVAMNEPLAIDGVTVHPDDIVVSDADGVVVIPKDAALQEKLLAWLDETSTKESDAKEMIGRGAMLSEAFARHGQL